MPLGTRLASIENETTDDTGVDVAVYLNYVQVALVELTSKTVVTVPRAREKLGDV